MDVGTLIRLQDGVLSRRQVLELGLHDDHIARMLRRREWSRLFPGVYVEHTGRPTWRQRAWGATLLHAPAALDATSALTAWGLMAAGPTDPIELAIAASRRVDDPVGVRTRRTRAWERISQLHLSPPRVRLETAALAAAARASSDDDAVALLGNAVQRRHTTVTRLQAALEDLTRLPRRRLLAEVLADVSAGAFSALERRYLRDVERAHGLPRGLRQVRVKHDGTTYVHDVLYPRQHTVVELDGRLGHELWEERWADLERDLRSLRDGTITLRAGWSQVVRPCRLADRVAGLLTARGWIERPRPCSEDCEAA